MANKAPQPRYVQIEHVSVVVLAGSLNRIPLYEGYQPGHKALLMFNGKPAVEYTLAALRGDRRVSSICIVGPQEELQAALASCDTAIYDFEPAGQTVVASLSAGLEHFRGAPAVLVATEDMPLITTAAVSDFLDACARTPLRYEHNILASFVPKRAFTGPYEHARKTFNRFRGMSVVHGNLALVEPNVTRNIEFAARLKLLYEGRKNWWTQLRAVGFRISAAYTFGAFLVPLLSLENMARIVSWRIGVGLVPVLVDHPEICVDIDEPKDYQFVKALLEPGG